MDTTLYTDLPTSIGLRGTVELPSRLRLSLGGGVFPSAYLSGIQSVATAAGWYSESLANLIDQALSRAYVVQPRVGFRPWQQHGFYFGGGVQRVFATGAEAGSGDVTRALEDAEPIDANTGGYFLKSRLTMLTVETGWEWCLAERWMVRANLGGAFTVGAHTEATPLVSDAAPLQRLREAGRTALESYLNQTYLQYVHTPTVGVEVGYRFR